ncbi:MAG: hypothetical protein CR997_10750 [Acidobacteria bacterium]|nr:MAG: hypothetical protein CR997_10750 [Acidobacteriota bacterium]
MKQTDYHIFRVGDWEVVVGKTALANDQLSIKTGKPKDFWFHIAGMPGSHVIARHPEHPDSCPREIRRVAAGLAAYFSKARKGGTCTVHWTTCSQVKKRPGAPAGQVVLKKFDVMKVKPLDPQALED